MCSVTTCDGLVHADLGLKTLKNRRDFHKLTWYSEEYAGVPQTVLGVPSGPGTTWDIPESPAVYM